MPSYLVTSRRPNGRRVTQFLPGPCGDAIVNKLEKYGHRDIILHMDDAMALTFDSRKIGKKFSPRELLILMRGGILSRSWMMQLHSIRQISFLLLFLFWLLTLAMRVGLGGSWNWFDTSVVIVLFVMPWLLPLIIMPMGVAGPYRRAHQALVWGRWEEAQYRIRRLAARLKPYQVAHIETQALVGLGRLDEAIDLWRTFGHGEQIPLWLWWGLMGDLYSLGRNPSKAIEAKEEALNLNPGCPTLLLGCALIRLRYGQDLARARALVKEAETHALADTLWFAYSMAQGMFALADNEAQKAQEHLERSLKQLRILGRQPLTATAEAEIRAYLAMACAQLGDGAQAKYHFQKAEPILRARHAVDLLGRCEAAAG